MQAPTRNRRIVVGDVHGELDGFKEIINHAGLIENHENWSGGNSMLIQRKKENTLSKVKAKGPCLNTIQLQKI
jgi:hypothetical protein